MNIQPITYNTNIQRNSFATNKTNVSRNNKTSFKGQEPSRITKFFAEQYAKRFLNSDKMQKFSEKLSKSNLGNVTQHLQSLEAAMVSSIYMKRTVTNKNLEKKERKTLAINQGMSLVLSTIGAYTFNSSLDQMNKKLETKYIALEEAKMLKAKNSVNAEKLAQMQKSLCTKLSGFRTVMPIITFSLIYRYISPVLITPFANKLGHVLNARADKKQAMQTNQKNTN